jgi:predicted lipoprotein
MNITVENWQKDHLQTIWSEIQYTFPQFKLSTTAYTELHGCIVVDIDYVRRKLKDGA